MDILHGEATPEMTRLVWLAERELLAIATNIGCANIGDAVALAEKIRDANNEFNKSVKGNRPGNSLLSWRDLRTVMTHFLRSIADEIERFDTPFAPLPEIDD
jgi:hypothetical protein